MAITDERVPVRFKSGTRVRDVVGIYFRFTSPRLLAGFLLALVVVRVVVADWSWWDLVAVVAVLAAQPFVEWIIHTFILHFRPKSVGSVTVDLHLAKKHRQHHQDPRKIADVFIPIRALVIGLPILVLVALWVFPLPIALTVLVMQAIVGNLYEWTHFYVHSGCKPTNRYARYIERAHRLHHYRNENFWMGVTNHTADHVLGTFPEKDEVPASPTAKTLGVE